MILTLLLIAAVGIYAMYALVGKRGGARTYPDSFTPTHAHSNIAIDAKTRRVWIREPSGRQIVLSPADITGWATASVEKSNQHGQCWNIKNFLEIRTTNLDKPLWRARFKDHQETFPSEKNHRELEEWYQRITAMLNHDAESANS